jgi:hypothetical protein
MAANKKISELTILGDSGNPVLVETVRDGANFKLLCNLQATAAPTVTNDSSKGYSVGSIWNYNGVIYTATDVSVGAAVWVAVGGASGGSLQDAYDIGNTIEGFDVVIDDTSNNVSITKGSTITGTYVIALGEGSANGNTGDYVNAIGKAASGNTGLGVNALGDGAAADNTGAYVNALGENAAAENIGTNVNALGEGSASGNTGSEVNALGGGAASYNTGDSVNALGGGAASYNTGTNINAIGVGAASYNTLSNMTIIGTNELSTYADHTAALLAINTGTGATAGHYLYINASTNSIGCVTIV